MHPVGVRPYAARLAAWSGRLVGLFAYVLYQLSIALLSQVAPLRALGTLAVVALGLVAMAAVVGAIAERVPALGPRARKALQTAYYVAVLANMAAIGLVIFWLHPLFAPPSRKAVALAGPVVLAALFWRQAEAERAMLLGLLERAGQAVLAVTFLSVPAVVAGALTDAPRLPGAPTPLGAEARRPDAPKRIILVSFDGLRLPSTTLYDAGLDTTPTLAALAAEGTSYSGVQAVSDRTAVALPCMTTGLYPQALFAQSFHEGARIRLGSVTGLAGHLAPAGYASYAALMALDVRSLGLENEFQGQFEASPLVSPNRFNTRAYLPLGPAFAWLMGQGPSAATLGADAYLNPRHARDAFAHGLAFLQATPGRAYLRVHVAIPHVPMFDVPPPGRIADLGTLSPRSYDEPDLKVATRRQMADFVRIYQNYARFGDAELGRFLAGLRAAGLYDDALIVVTADHGEDLVNQRYPLHAHGILNSRVTRVPLVIRRPGGRGHGGGRVDDRLASQLDLVPTVLASVYDRLPAGLAGVPLDAPPDPERVVYAWALESRLAGRPNQFAASAAYQGRFRYLLQLAPNGWTPTATLTDWRDDPGGLHDMSAREPRVAARLRERLLRDNALGLTPP